MDEEVEGENVDMSPVKGSRVEEYITHARIENEAPNNTSTHSFHRTITEKDRSVSMERFCENFRIEIVEYGGNEIQFDMIGIEAPIANAFRRIMISEVPTMCVDRVIVNNNTSVLPDEVLAHRIGLVPIKLDPRLFRMKKKMRNEMKRSLLDFEKDKPPDGDYRPLTQLRCNEDVLFRLKVACTRSQSNPKVLENNKVYSKSMEWVPFGNQKNRFREGIRPVFEDILLCELSPGQVIDMELYVEKGIGKIHAKWSPVCTASYRLMPDIRILETIEGEEAEEMKNKCPKKVFDIEDDELYVKNVRRCSFCKECIRNQEKPKIKLSKIKNHFIFTVESSGVYTAAEIFRESVGIFYNKCKNKMKSFEETVNQIDVGEKVLY